VQFLVPLNLDQHLEINAVGKKKKMYQFMKADLQVFTLQGVVKKHH